MDPGRTKPRARHATNVCMLLAGPGSRGQQNGGLLKKEHTHLPAWRPFSGGDRGLHHRAVTASEGPAGGRHPQAEQPGFCPPQPCTCPARVMLAKV